MIPPHYIGCEVGQELIRGRESVGRFRCFGVPVVALPPLIVIAQHGVATNDVREPIPEFMRRWRYRLSNLPHHDLNECVRGYDHSAAKQRCGLHVGENTNTKVCCQLPQHLPSDDLVPNAPNEPSAVWAAG